MARLFENVICRRGASLSLLALLAACGGDSSGPTPPQTTGETVTVTVATSGEDLDADGYTVALGGRNAAVGSSGSVSFDDIAPGTYEVRLTGVADNCAVEGGGARSVTVSEGSGAQASFAVTCEADDGLATVACPDLTLGANEGMPLDFIGLGRLPASLAEPWAALTWAGGETARAAWVRVADDGAAELQVPLHPSGAIEGGHLTVRVTDGEQACAPVELDIAALPPAPGAFLEVVDLMDEVIGLQAALFGLSLADLEVDDPTELPDYLQPLAIAHEILSGPEHASSVRAVAAELDDDGRAVLDAMTARAGIAGALATAAARLAVAAPERAPARQEIPGFPCQSFGLGDVVELDDCMVLADEVRELSVAFEATHTELIAMVGAMTTVEDATPEQLLAATVWRVARGAIGGAYRLLPSQFDNEGSYLARFDSIVFEDDAETHSWDEARALATSLGVVFLVDDIQPLLMELSHAQWQVLVHNGFTGASAAAQAAEMVRTKVVQALLHNEQILWPGKDFGPVDVTGELWSVDEIAGESVELTERQRYVGRRAGPSILRVRTQPQQSGGEALFGGREFRIDEPVEVVKIEIVVYHYQEDIPTLGDVWVEPGEEHVLVAEVLNSVHPDSLEIRDEELLQGEAEFVPSDPFFPPEAAFVRYTAPEEPDFEEPDLLSIAHTSRSGARANSAEDRIGTKTIRFAEVTISPRSACVEPGDELQLEAEVKGPDDESVTWSLEGDGPGSIDEDGLYTAPEEPDEPNATIVARSKAVPWIDDEVTIQIGGCTCGWSVTLNGELFEGQPGDSALFQELVPTGPFQELVAIQLRTADGQVVHLSAEDPETVLTGGAAAFAGSVGGNIGTSVAHPYLAYDTRYPGAYTGEEPEWAEAEIVLDEYVVATSLRGSVQGRVALHMNEVDLDDAPRVPFEATFQITLPPDYSEVLRYRRTFVCEVPAPGGP